MNPCSAGAGSALNDTAVVYSYRVPYCKYMRTRLPRGTPISTRLMYWVTVDVQTRCWTWAGALQPNGYAQINVNGSRVLAHRASYEAFVGPIPPGLTIDHLCRNKGCVNPDHLEPVTRRENILRSNNMAARNAAKTHCAQGHAYTPENTLPRRPAGRICRTCHTAASRRQRERARA